MQEHGGALGRAEKENRVDTGHVDAFVENVNREDGAELAVAQTTEGRVALRVTRIAGDRHRGEARIAQLAKVLDRLENSILFFSSCWAGSLI